MRLGQFTLEAVERAAIRTTCFAAMIQRNHHFRVRVPQIHIRHRAGEWQIICGDFDITLGDVLFAQNISPDFQFAIEKKMITVLPRSVKYSLATERAADAFLLRNQKRPVAIS
jgi:hypothetical protein